VRKVADPCYLYAYNPIVEGERKKEGDVEIKIGHYKGEGS
jgi:hypothetical protein